MRLLAKPVKPSALYDALVTVLAGVESRFKLERPPELAADPEMAKRHPLKILLAEDNAVNQKLALRLLANMGYIPDVVGDGLQALAALDGSDHDVVLMDVQMPELDGLEATRRIRRNWPDRPLHIVAMTANAMAGDRDACIAAGMNDYVSKPIRPAELAAASRKRRLQVALAREQQKERPREHRAADHRPGRARRAARSPLAATRPSSSSWRRPTWPRGRATSTRSRTRWRVATSKAMVRPGAHAQVVQRGAGRGAAISDLQGDRARRAARAEPTGWTKRSPMLDRHGTETVAAMQAMGLGGA